MPEETVLEPASVVETSAAEIPQENNVLVNTFNRNALIVENAVELATAVIANIDESIVGNTINSSSVTTQALREAILDRLKMNLNIKD